LGVGGGKHNEDQHEGAYDFVANRRAHVKPTFEIDMVGRACGCFAASSVKLQGGVAITGVSS